MISFALKSFAKYGVAKLIQFVEAVVLGMTDNVATFPTPDVPLGDITAKKNELKGYLAAAAGGDHTAVEKARIAQNELNGLLKKNADYVTRTSANNRAKVICSGYLPNKERASATYPIFDITISNVPGQAQGIHKKITGAVSYIWMRAETDSVPNEEDWRFGGATSDRKFLYENLHSGKNYWFRCCAVLRKQENTPWSDPIKRIIP